MRKFIPIGAVLLVAVLAQAQTWTESQLAPTEVRPPLLTATDGGSDIGVDLMGVRACGLNVCAPAGCFLDGGTMVFEKYNHHRKLWSQDGDQNKSIPTSFGRCKYWPDLEAPLSTGRVKYTVLNGAFQNPDGGPHLSDGGRPYSVQLECIPRAAP